MTTPLVIRDTWWFAAPSTPLGGRPYVSDGVGNILRETRTSPSKLTPCAEGGGPFMGISSWSPWHLPVCTAPSIFAGTGEAVKTPQFPQRREGLQSTGYAVLPSRALRTKCVLCFIHLELVSRGNRKTARNAIQYTWHGLLPMETNKTLWYPVIHTNTGIGNIYQARVVPGTWVVLPHKNEPRLVMLLDWTILFPLP